MDINLQKGFGPSEAAKRVPPLRGGRPVSPSTIVRWIVDGVTGPDGDRVHLEAVRLGARWVTDDASIQRFAAQLTPARTDRPIPRTPSALRRADEHAARELKRLGFGTDPKPSDSTSA